MLIQQQISVDVAPEAAWPFFRDIPAVAACVPGVEEIQPSGPESYRGVMGLRVGPLGLKLAGTVTVLERDEDQRRLVLSVSAEDRRLASAALARVTVRLEAAEGPATLLRVDADATIRGKLGQFGQAMIKRVADDVLKQFATCLRQRLTSGERG